MSTTTVSGLRDSTPLSGPSAASSDMNAEFYTTSTIVDAVNEFIRTAPPASISKTPLTQEHLETTTTMSTMFGAPTSSLTPHKVNVADLSHSLQHFGIVDYVVFVLMLVVCAVIGFYFGFIEKKKKKKKGNRDNVERRGSEALDYLVGGRKMKVFPVSLSLVASFISGISLLGTSTEIYVYGTQYAFILFTLVISGVISWYIFLPVFCNLQLTSTYEYFEMRFGSTIRYFCSFLFIISMVLYLPVAIYVPALTFSQVSGLSVHAIAPIVCLVCIFYTSAGGLKAVIWTDVIQSFAMYATVLTICIKGTLDLGGLGVVLERNLAGGRLNIPALSWDPTIRLSMTAVLIGGTLHKIQSSDVNQVSIQRFMSLPGLKQVRQTMIIFTIGLMALLGCCCYMGLIAYATYHDCDPLTSKLITASDQLPTLLAMRILAVVPGLPGCFVAGVFSAALSTLSTGLNSLSCVVTQDVILPLYKRPISDRAMGFILRFIVVFFGVVCIALIFVVEKLGMVLQLATMTSAVCMGPLLAIYTLGICCPWVNEKSTLTGSIVSFVIFGWICTKAQLMQMNNEMHHPKLPVSVEGCTYGFSNATLIEKHQDYDGERNLYYLSFYWYTGLSCIVGVLVAFLASIVFGTNNVADMDPALISPVLRRFLPTKEPCYSAVDLGVSLNTKIGSPAGFENENNK